MLNCKLIIDFDSTFIKVEALDKLAEFSCTGRPDVKKTIEKIARITAQGMEGRITFRQSLNDRMKLIGACRKDVDKLSKFLKSQVSDSIKRNRSFFIKNSANIYMISGGFRDYILPVVESYKIERKNVFANDFIYDAKGVITGFDKKNPLSESQGKLKQIKRLKLKGKVVVAGDGYTDYEIKAGGAANTFIAYTENIRRENIISVANFEMDDMSDVIDFVSSNLRI